jgi:transcriptional regulator with XRE-family HTH domain
MHPNRGLQPNSLDIYRRKLRFSAHYVTRLLGYADVSQLSRYERGQRLPSLENALKLAIILRTPVEFLFPSLFLDLRETIRAEEERFKQQPSRQDTAPRFHVELEGFHLWDEDDTESSYGFPEPVTSVRASLPKITLRV